MSKRPLTKAASRIYCCKHCRVLAYVNKKHSYTIITFPTACVAYPMSFKYCGRNFSSREGPNGSSGLITPANIPEKVRVYFMQSWSKVLLNSVFLKDKANFTGMNRISPRHQSTSRRRTKWLHVIIVQDDSFFCQFVDIWCWDLIWSMKTDICPTLKIAQKCQ